MLAWITAQVHAAPAVGSSPEMNRVARTQLLPKLRRLAAGLQRSPEKALLAAIVARAICAIGILRQNLRLRHKRKSGYAQDETEG